MHKDGNRNCTEIPDWAFVAWGTITVFLILLCSLFILVSVKTDAVRPDYLNELEEIKVDHEHLKQACLDRGFAQYRVRDWGVAYFELNEGNGLSGPYNFKKLDRLPFHIRENLKKDAEINRLKDKIQELERR